MNLENTGSGFGTRPQGSCPKIRLHSCNYKLDFRYFKFGFGYDDLSDTYKVVIILSDVKSPNWEVKVLCLGDTCWRNVLTCPAFPIPGTFGQPVSGTVNWLAIRASGFDYRWETVTVNQLVILSYDLNKETYRYLSMPEGCLCLSYGHRRTHLVVWLMREFGVQKSWTRLLNVSYEHLQVFPPYELAVAPLCMSKNDDVLLLANFPSSQFVFYNRRDNRIERTEDFNGKEPLFSHSYVQSLVLPYRN